MNMAHPMLADIGCVKGSCGTDCGLSPCREVAMQARNVRSCFGKQGAKVPHDNEERSRAGEAIAGSSQL